MARSAAALSGAILGAVIPAPRWSRRWIEIEVADTGTGMDAETRRRAFEPFFTTKGERGTGLGLATVSKVVQQAGGIIELDSTPGGGTTFRLCFAPSTSVDALATPSSAGAVPPRQERRRLLLAEDDRSIRESLARALRSAGFDVAEVADLAQASAALSRPFDILVTDGILPGGSTSALVDDFLATRPGARVIVCTGYLEDELPPRHTGGPRLELLAKPFAPGDLLARLSTDSAQLDA